MNRTTNNCTFSSNNNKSTAPIVELFLLPLIKKLLQAIQSYKSMIALSLIPSIIITVIIIVVTVIAILLIKRYYAYYILKYKSNIPTILWKPKFLNYSTFHNDHQNNTNINKMSSSTIKNILPRMDKLANEYSSNCYGIYGTIYGISTKIIHIAHPIPARLVLTNTNKKEPAYNHFKNFCGDGVFTSDGAIWKQKRASVSYCLRQRRYNTIASSDSCSSMKNKEEAILTNNKKNTNTTILSLEEIVQNAIKDFIQCITNQNTNQSINKDNDNGSSNNNELIIINDIVPILQRITLSIIYQYLTHEKIDIIIPKSQQEQHEEQKVSSSSTSKNNNLLSKYLESIIKIRMIVLAHSRSIWFLLPNIFYKLFSPMYKEEEYVCNYIRTFAKNAYSRTTTASNGSISTTSNNLSSPLYLLKSLHHKNKNMYYDYTSSSSTTSSNNNNTTDLAIEHETITLLFAGQDTSAATMSWILHLLSIYPDKQYKLLQDIYNNNNNTMNMNNTNNNHDKMTYLDAVIKESMRLYPVAPFVVRQLTNDIIIPNEDDNNSKTATSTTTLYKGTFACIWIYGMHHNTHLWNRPEDFIPERWLNNNNKDKGIEQGAFMPFAIGPRNCIGQSIANVVVRNMLKGILSRYIVLDPKLVKVDTTSTTAKTNATNALDYRNSLRKDMQAGFTVLPLGGVSLILQSYDYNNDDIESMLLM